MSSRWNGQRSGGATRRAIQTDLFDHRLRRLECFSPCGINLDETLSSRNPERPIVHFPALRFTSTTAFDGPHAFRHTVGGQVYRHSGGREIVVNFLHRAAGQTATGTEPHSSIAIFENAVNYF